MSRSGADALDYLLLFLGVLGGLGNGVMLPLFAIVFGGARVRRFCAP
jgi:hypothetical protein